MFHYPVCILYCSTALNINVNTKKQTFYFTYANRLMYHNTKYYLLCLKKNKIIQIIELIILFFVRINYKMQ